MTRDPAPGLPLARTLLDATQPLPARRVPRGRPRPSRRGARAPRVDGSAADSAAAVVRDLPDLGDPRRRAADRGGADAAARRPCCPRRDRRRPAVLDLLAAVILDAEDEIRGALRAGTCRCAVRRYQTGYDEATAADARAMLYRLAARAVRVGRAKDCRWVGVARGAAVQLLVRGRLRRHRHDRGGAGGAASGAVGGVMSPPRAPSATRPRAPRSARLPGDPSRCRGAPVPRRYHASASGTLPRVPPACRRRTWPAWDWQGSQKATRPRRGALPRWGLEPTTGYSGFQSTPTACRRAAWEAA